jgi:hypothetical protein
MRRSSKALQLRLSDWRDELDLSAANISVAPSGSILLSKLRENEMKQLELQDMSRDLRVEFNLSASINFVAPSLPI